MAVSANRLELLQIADAVAREKSIDKQIVISRDGGGDPEGREVALRPRQRNQGRDRSQDRRDAAASLAPGRREGRERGDRDHARRSADPQSGGADGRLDRRAAAADRFRAHRRASRQAGHLPEGARRRAREAVRRIQGPHRRDRARHGQARRIRQRGRRSRPRRSASCGATS